MSHSGNLGTQAVANDIHDVRGTIVRGSAGEELGQVDDVIIDHNTMQIRYLVLVTPAGAFLVPADRVSADVNHENGLATEATRQQIESSPQYDASSGQAQDDWKKYEQAFKKYWDEEPVMHIKGTDRTLVPPDAAPPASVAGSGTREVNAADLFPRRISDVFSDPAPGAGKVTLRPERVARAEEAAAGVALLKPRWWDAFEDYLRTNKSDIQSRCSHCGPAAGRKREVA